MIEPLLGDFVALLRRGGLRVSTAERLDATRALAAVGLDDRDTAREALAATLIKRAGDRARFDELFALHFDRAGGSDRAARVALAELGITGGLPEVREAAERAGLADARSPLQAGNLAFRTMDGLAGAPGEGSLGGGAAVVELRRAIRGFVDDELRRRDPDAARRLAVQSLADRAFAQLTPSEQVALDAEVHRLARRLAARLPEPRPSPRRGRLDVRATLRRSWATGGVPFEVRRRHRPVRKPRLVVLCDVSDSVRLVSRFLLAIVHTLARRYDRVHSFVFVADLGDASALFASRDVDRAIADVLAGAVVDPWQSSDYGRALGVLCDRHLGKIGRRTTVLVLGDARSNDRPPRPDLLARVRRRAHRVLWLNPEPASAWGWGDSAMRVFAPHCDHVLTVSNLASLRAAVDVLVSSPRGHRP